MDGWIGWWAGRLRFILLKLLNVLSYLQPPAHPLAQINACIHAGRQAGRQARK